MNFFDKIKATFSGNTDEIDFLSAIDQSWKEYKRKSEYFYYFSANETNTWKNEVKNWPDKKKVRFLLWLVPIIHNYKNGKRAWFAGDAREQNYVRESYVQVLL